MSIRLNKVSFIHIDNPRDPNGYTLQSVRIVGTVGLNPFRSEPDEPKYSVSDIRVKSLCGQDITNAVEEWEFTRIHEELIEGYGDAAQEAAEIRATEAQEAYQFTSQAAPVC